jgi:hypothetical protein
MTEPIPPVVSSAVMAYAKGIRPSLFILMINSFFVAIFLGLLFYLFCSSSSTLRRQPVFVMNVAALALGTALGVMSNQIQVQMVPVIYGDVCSQDGVPQIHAVLSPFGQQTTIENLVFTALYLWLPWLSEAVLIIRLVAIIGTENKRRLAAVLFFPVIMKLLRAAINIFDIVQLSRAIVASRGKSNPVATAGSTGWWPTATISISEMLDNRYACFIK